MYLLDELSAEIEKLLHHPVTRDDPNAHAVLTQFKQRLDTLPRHPYVEREKTAEQLAWERRVEEAIERRKREKTAEQLAWERRVEEAIERRKRRIADPLPDPSRYLRDNEQLYRGPDR